MAAAIVVPAAAAADDAFNIGNWPFCPPVRPSCPRSMTRPGSPIRSTRSSWPRWKSKGSTPTVPADKLTLLRRVTFDLTGLAPTLAEQQAFLADESPDAYDALVDRLLDSPHYGERWAQHWLDVVRYAESDGFKADALRPTAHRYRDYVIRAFNADLPYDRFIRQQLAGDELEPDNPEALIATGLNRLVPRRVQRGQRRATPAGDSRRPDRRHGPDLPGADDRLRPVPRPQVRSDLAGRLLPLQAFFATDAAPRRHAAGGCRASGAATSASRPCGTKPPAISAREIDNAAGRQAPGRDERRAGKVRARAARGVLKPARANARRSNSSLPFK